MRDGGSVEGVGRVREVGELAPNAGADGADMRVMSVFIDG